MARRRRLGPKDVTQHVVQRGNNRRVCFSSEQDYVAYIAWLKKFSIQYNVAIHAWVLMTNHVHILCTPLSDNLGVSKMMQSLGRHYVRHFNRQNKCTGTLWEARFKSSLVCTSTYLLRLYRYIELNPVRAHMVDHPAKHKWSSYQITALGKHSDLCQPHRLYNELGTSPFERMRAYRRLFDDLIPQDIIDRIRVCNKRELVLGSDKFKDEIEHLLGEKLKADKLGPPFRNNVH